MIEHQEPEVMNDLKCPKCGGENIRPIRGEIARKLTASECKCTDCDCDFLISSSVKRKPSSNR